MRKELKELDQKYPHSQKYMNKIMEFFNSNNNLQSHFQFDKQLWITTQFKQARQIGTMLKKKNYDCIQLETFSMIADNF